MMWIKKAIMMTEKSRGTRLEAAKVRWHGDIEMREGRKEGREKKKRHSLWYYCIDYCCYLRFRTS
jgi:hypothetical protein